jgi:hypothetical protein
MLKALIMPAISMISVSTKRVIPRTPFEITRGERSWATNRTGVGTELTLMLYSWLLPRRPLQSGSGRAGWRLSPPGL